MEKKPTVYLCGPITAVPENKAKQWRERAIRELAPEIIGIDPTREEISSVRESEMEKTTGKKWERMRHGARTLSRNRFDLSRSDLLLVNFLGCNAASIGSVGEIFWADLLRIPVVIIREDTGNIHDHDLLNAIAGWIFNDFDAAIRQVKTLLSFNNTD